MKRLRTWAEHLGVAGFAGLFLVFVVQVTARLVWNQPLPWTDELAVMLYLMSVLWAAALICRDREHVAFDLLYQAAPRAVRRLMAILACALVGGLCAWALPATLDYIAFMRREPSAVLGLPLAWVYAPFALLLVALVLRNARRLWRLLSADWETHL